MKSFGPVKKIVDLSVCRRVQGSRYLTKHPKIDCHAFALSRRRRRYAAANRRPTARDIPNFGIFGLSKFKGGSSSCPTVPCLTRYSAVEVTTT